MIEDEPEKYQTHFSQYIKKGIEADGIEELYKKVHAAIRADPSIKKAEKQPPKEHKRYIILMFVTILLMLSKVTDLSELVGYRTFFHDYMTNLLNENCTEFMDFLLFRYNLKKLTYDERRTKLIARLEALNSAVDEDEDDDE